MTIRVCALVMIGVLLSAQPGPAQVTGAEAGAKAGYVHCATVELLEKQDRILRASGIRTWHRWMQEPEHDCHVSDGGEYVAVVRITDDENEPVTLDGREVVCLRSEGWDGCHYAFREAVWTPKR